MPFFCHLSIVSFVLSGCHSFCLVCERCFSPSKLITIQVKGIAKIKDTWVTPILSILHPPRAWDNGMARQVLNCCFVCARMSERVSERECLCVCVCESPFLTLQFYHSCARFNIFFRFLSITSFPIIIVNKFFSHHFPSSAFRLLLLPFLHHHFLSFIHVSTSMGFIESKNGEMTMDCDQLHDSNFPNIHNDFCALSSTQHFACIFI